MSDEKQMKAYNLQQEQIAIVKEHAEANYDGNESMALRRIITEWAQLKAAGLDVLPLSALMPARAPK